MYVCAALAHGIGDVQCMHTQGLWRTNQFGRGLLMVLGIRQTCVQYNHPSANISLALCCCVVYLLPRCPPSCLCALVSVCLEGRGVGGHCHSICTFLLHVNVLSINADSH